METPTPVNHVFVDFENVHSVDSAVIGKKSVVFTILLGAKQTKLDVALVEVLLANANSVQLVRLTSSGKNALDFALAYYVGRAVAGDPTGFFHIVAKDKGYDALIDHLKTNGIRIRRHSDFSTLTFSAPVKISTTTKPNGSDERARAFGEHLKTHPNNRPKRRTTLLRHIKTHFGNKPTEHEAEMILKKLESDGRVAISDSGVVSYL